MFRKNYVRKIFFEHKTFTGNKKKSLASRNTEGEEGM